MSSGLVDLAGRPINPMGETLEQMEELIAALAPIFVAYPTPDQMLEGQKAYQKAVFEGTSLADVREASCPWTILMSVLGAVERLQTGAVVKGNRKQRRIVAAARGKE